MPEIGRKLTLKTIIASLLLRMSLLLEISIKNPGAF